MMNEKRRQGLETPVDQKVPISVRDWNAVKLALWRNKVGWQIAARAAFGILERCAHVNGCPGKDDETEPCVNDRYDTSDSGKPAVLITRGCPDREQRMNALVVLNAARQFAPLAARPPAQEPYFAPSREYFSEVLTSRMALEIELETTKAELARLQSATVEPPPNTDGTIAALTPPSPSQSFYDRFTIEQEEEQT